MIVTTADLLAAHPFVAGIPPAQLERMAIWGHGVTLDEDMRVFDEGGHADRFWLVISGRIRLDTNVPGRSDVTVETLGAGTVLGWSWMFEPYRWHFGATVGERTHAIVLDAAGIRSLCTEDPVLGHDLTRRFMQVVVDRLQQTRLRLLDMYGRTGS